MRLATFRGNGHRQVGRLTGDGQAIEPFDLAAEIADAGLFALIDKLPPTAGAAIPLDQVRLEAATGTPAGVGIGFDPPKFLKAGDVVRIEIGGIGVLENPVVARERAA
jgi:hypothetical protein